MKVGLGLGVGRANVGSAVVGVGVGAGVAVAPGVGDGPVAMEPSRPGRNRIPAKAAATRTIPTASSGESRNDRRRGGRGGRWRGGWLMSVTQTADDRIR